MISNADRTRIAEAVKTAESGTTGEIVCVLMRQSSTYAYAPILWATFAALATPWLLLAFTHLSVARILGCQIVVFIAASLLLAWTPLRMAITPRAIQRTRAHRAAMEQFFARNVTHTPNRSGVMIFVSMAERYAHIVPDLALEKQVPRQDWRAVVDLLTAHMKEQRIADGFVAATEKCGDILAKYAPSDGAPHPLPDRIYVL